MSNIDIEFTDPMAQRIYSVIKNSRTAVEQYRGLPYKDNYHWGQVEECLRQALEHAELAAGHWKRGGRREQ